MNNKVAAFTVSEKSSKSLTCRYRFSRLNILLFYVLSGRVPGGGSRMMAARRMMRMLGGISPNDLLMLHIMQEMFN